MGLHQLITEFEFVIKLGDTLFNLVEIEVNVFIDGIDHVHNQLCQIGWALAGCAARTVLIALDGVLRVEINAP